MEKTASFTKCYGNVFGDGNIANLLAEKYGDLYNSVSYNKDEMYHLMSNVEKFISDKDRNKHSCIVTVDDIVEDLSHVIKPSYMLKRPHG